MTYFSSFYCSKVLRSKLAFALVLIAAVQFSSTLESRWGCSVGKLCANPELCLSEINWLSFALYMQRIDRVMSSLITQKIRLVRSAFSNVIMSVKRNVIYTYAVHMCS